MNRKTHNCAVTLYDPHIFRDLGNIFNVGIDGLPFPLMAHCTPLELLHEQTRLDHFEEECQRQMCVMEDAQREAKRQCIAEEENRKAAENLQAELEQRASIKHRKKQCAKKMIDERNQLLRFEEAQQQGTQTGHASKQGGTA